jgi:ketosteroid isomerase-like protein
MRLSFLFLLVLLSSISFGQTKTKALLEEQLIRTQRNFSNLAIANHDTLTIGNFWTDDFLLISSRNSEVSGREKNRKGFIEDFKSKRDVVYVRTPDKIDVFAEWNMASETGTWVGTWKAADGNVKITGTYYAKWHKINGEWKIRAEVFTPLNCTGSNFCKLSPLPIH